MTPAKHFLKTLAIASVLLPFMSVACADAAPGQSAAASNRKMEKAHPVLLHLTDVKFVAEPDGGENLYRVILEVSAECLDGETVTLEHERSARGVIPTEFCIVQGNRKDASLEPVASMPEPPVAPLVHKIKPQQAVSFHVASPVFRIDNPNEEYTIKYKGKLLLNGNVRYYSLSTSRTPAECMGKSGE